jgi:3-oxoadipate enol-lactonase
LMEAVVRETGINVEMSGNRSGGGPALVFVHGAGGDAGVWGLQARALGGRGPVCRIELPGHGGSGGAGETSIEAYTEWVLETVSGVLDGAPFILGGHSMGGAVALQAALEGDRGPSGLILAATGAKLGVTPLIFRLLEEDFEGFVETIDRAAIGPLAPAGVRAVVMRGLRRCTPETIHGDFTACSRFDVRERLGEIRVPTLVICGEEDLLTPVAHSEFLAAEIEGARLEKVPGAGHMVMLESPDAVTGAILDFLEGPVSRGRHGR